MEWKVYVLEYIHLSQTRKYCKSWFIYVSCNIRSKPYHRVSFALIVKKALGLPSCLITAEGSLLRSAQYCMEFGISFRNIRYVSTSRSSYSLIRLLMFKVVRIQQNILHVPSLTRIRNIVLYSTYWAITPHRSLHHISDLHIL